MTADEDRAALAALAALAGLPLESERAAALAAALADVRTEHGELRALPRALEAHVVFDPRWD